MLRRIVIRRILLSRSPLVLPSRSLLRIATQVWKLPPKIIHYIPNGIDIDSFGAPVGSGVGRGMGPLLTIGTIAALREEKNIGRLLRAFSLVMNKSTSQATPARLVIVGDGPARRALEAPASELGIAALLEFAGQRQDTPEFYGRFDIFALSSDPEQMPLSVIEAMAAGLPVVSTDVGDVLAMVSEPNVPFVTRLDDAALAASLYDLMADPLLRQGIGAANRQKAQRDFDQTAMFEAHASLWRGTLAAGDKRRQRSACTGLPRHRFCRPRCAMARPGAAGQSILFPDLDLDRLPAGGAVYRPGAGRRGRLRPNRRDGTIQPGPPSTRPRLASFERVRQSRAGFALNRA